MEDNPHQTVRALSVHVHRSASTVSRQSKKIGKAKKFDLFVSHELSEGKQLKLYEICGL